MASDSEDVSPAVNAAMSAPSVIEPLLPTDPFDSEKPAPFEYITENTCLTERQTNRERKKAKRMVCECVLDEEYPSSACGADCLNRLLMIECGSRCPCGELCTNRRFQKCQYTKAEVYKTEFKGWGLRALEDTPPDSFVMEYCGEVCTTDEFVRRKKEYHKERRRHYYFMSLKSDEILDATRKGNMSRFINHSCDPNCETQKWTVNGLLRIGFFTVRHVKAGEELTFDYKFQRFGEDAQKCYCGSANCRGILGGPPPKDNRRAGELGVRRERRRREGVVVDTLDEVERSVYDLVGNKGRLVNQEQALPLSRAMIQAELPQQRLLFLSVLQKTENAACLKKFLAFQGLPLLWSWMVDSSDMPAMQQNEMRMQLLKTLNHLPITTKNQIEDNKILPVVQKWSVTEEDPNEIKQESLDHTPIVSPQSPDITDNILPITSSEMEETTHGQDGEGEPSGLVADAEALMDSDPAPQGDEVAMGSEEGVESRDDDSQVHFTKGQSPTDHIGVPDETPEEVAQVALELTDKISPDAAEEMLSEGDVEGLGEGLVGSPGESRQPQETLPAEDAPTDPEGGAQDSNTSASDPDMSSESLHVVSDEECTAGPCTKTEVDSPPISAVDAASTDVTPPIAAQDVASTDVSPVVGSGTKENTVTSPKATKEEEEEEDEEEDDDGPSVSAPLSPFDSETEQVPLPLQQDPPHTPVSGMEVVSMATQLLERWQDLKEVFKIPKKKSNPSGQQEEQISTATNVVDRTAEKIDRVRKEAEVQQQKAATFWPSPLEHMRKRRDRPIRSEWRDKIPRTLSPHAETGANLRLLPLPQSIPLVAPGNQLPVQQMDEVRIPSLFDAPSYSLTQQPPTSALSMGMPMPAQPTPNIASLLPSSLQQLASLLPHPMALAAQQFPMQQQQPSNPQTEESAVTAPPKSLDVDDKGQLPENWKMAFDTTGNAYYYHLLTRKSQWERPTAMEEIEDNPIEMVEMDMVTPSPITPSNDTSGTPPQTTDPVGMPRTPEGSPPTTEEEESTQFVTSTTGQSSTKEVFRNQTSKVVLQCLNKHRKPDCKFGRIMNTHDFKHLARKITHAIMEKEASHKGGYEQLQFGPSTLHKTKKYIKEYMKKCGPVYKRT